jgi:riboflavin-specific deaminase-like protein
VVLFNSHGGNRAAIDAAALALRAEHDLLVVKASYFRFARPRDVELPDREWKHGLHGGAVETAMMLHLRPDLVDRSAVADFPSSGAELEGSLRRVAPEGEAPFAWLAEDLNPQGVVGDARLATAEMGARLVEHYGGVLAEVILDTRAFPIEALARSAFPGTRTSIDERTAWALVLAITPDGTAGRVVASDDPSVWLEFGVDGSWRASGPMSDAARDVFDIYVPLRTAPDLVIGQLGQSLDGRIATDAGASHFVTGRPDIERLHRLRALVDAVVVGASTVAHDDPRLTVRLVEGPSPVRVVLDPSGRLDEARRVFTDSGARTLLVTREDTPDAPDASREEVRVPWSEHEGFDLFVLLARLRSRGLRRVLVEGGGVTVSRFLQAGLLDRLHLTVAPMLIGSGRPSITLDAIDTLDQALRPRCRRFTLGEDVLFDLDLRRASA